MEFKNGVYFDIEAIALEKMEREQRAFLKAAAEAGFPVVTLMDELIFDVPDDRWTEFMELALKHFGGDDEAVAEEEVVQGLPPRPVEN